jgi:hypothetical protein
MQEMDVSDWRVTGLGHPLHRTMTFTQAGVVLGRGTLSRSSKRKGWRRAVSTLMAARRAYFPF